MYKFSQSSLDELKTCEQDLQEILKLAITRSVIDFGISEGHRSIERQQFLYNQGRTTPGNIVTNVDGINKKSKHNYYPSRAMDVFAYVPGRGVVYDDIYMGYLAGLFDSISKELKAAGKIKATLRWGGNWDGDGELKTDQKLVDLPHFEI